MIEINHLVKKYGNHVAVDDLNLTIEPGKIYGFLGPNGAGKSTTMNILTGYLAATSGEVKINGFDILSQPEEAKKCIGYLPELPPVYMEMTVQEYMNFVAELKKLDKTTRRQNVEEVMELTKITEMKDRLIRNLSKGYRQRVGLAQAVLGYPEVIILDEPTVGLDPKQIIEMRELIKQLGQKHTIILSSHILSEVSAVCDHIFIISKGKLVASDSTENLTSLMSGGQELTLVLKSEPETAEGALAGIEGVENITAVLGAEKGTSEIKITADKNVDVREQVFYRCADNRLPILEMRTEGKSLEDIFLELTDQKTAAVEEQDATESPEMAEVSQDVAEEKPAENDNDAREARD